MLTPEYFENKDDKLLQIYQGLEDFILKDIARRLLAAGKMTATADRLIYKLNQAGKSQEEIIKELQKITRLSNAEVRRLLQGAVLTSWEDDRETLTDLAVKVSSPLETPAIRTVMDAEYKKTQGELENLTRTTMRQSQRDLIKMMDDAEIRVASGTQSYNAAVNDILDQYAGRGIVIEYPTGTRRTLEAAVRCCVVTGMNQTAAQVTNQYVKEADCEVVLVSAHLGARVKRPNDPDLAGHDLWQGKVYRINGSEDGYPNLLESTGYDIDMTTGEGRVVDPRGLHGYNCRHSHKPWDKKLRNPYTDENGNLKIDSEENRERYELSQKQRAMERSIRSTKRKITVAEEELRAASEEDREKIQNKYDSLKKRLTSQDEKYNDFCKDNGLATQYDRLRAG